MEYATVLFMFNEILFTVKHLMNNFAYLSSFTFNFQIIYI